LREDGCAAGAALLEEEEEEEKEEEEALGGVAAARFAAEASRLRFAAGACTGFAPALKAAKASAAAALAERDAMLAGVAEHSGMAAPSAGRRVPLAAALRWSRNDLKVGPMRRLFCALVAVLTARSVKKSQMRLRRYARATLQNAALKQRMMPWSSGCRTELVLAGRKWKMTFL
jgi:hypothetical protein